MGFLRKLISSVGDSALNYDIVFEESKANIRFPKINSRRAIIVHDVLQWTLPVSEEHGAVALVRRMDFSIFSGRSLFLINY